MSYFLVQLSFCYDFCSTFEPDSEVYGHFSKSSAYVFFAEELAVEPSCFRLIASRDQIVCFMKSLFFHVKRKAPQQPALLMRHLVWRTSSLMPIESDLATALPHYAPNWGPRGGKTPPGTNPFGN